MDDDNKRLFEAAARVPDYSEARRRIEDLEASVRTLRNVVVALTELLGHTAEAAARTGAFDQAGNGERITAVMESIHLMLNEAGADSPETVLRSAVERIDNVPHIRRLSEQG